VLYVVDSVTRQWIIRAGQAQQRLEGSAAPFGTYAAGVHKMTEVVPHIMDEVLMTYPHNQKVSFTIHVFERIRRDWNSLWAASLHNS